MTDLFAIEVKTTLASTRKHRFSLEQLRPNLPIDVFIVSIILTELQRGEKVHELIDEIYAELGDHELRARFFRQCLRKGGAEVYSSDLKLSTLPNAASVATYNARDLPAPSINKEDRIYNVHFDMELDDRNSLDLFGAKSTSILAKLWA